MAKTDKYQLHFESHQLISKYVEWLKKKVQKSIQCVEDPKSVFCVNIMYNVPRFSGTLHLTDFTKPGEACVFASTSPFFKEVYKINAIFTTKEDIRKLVNFGISYSTTRTAAVEILRSWKDKEKFPELILLPTLKDDECQIPSTIEDILTGLLITFSDLKKYLPIITKLQGNGHLSAVVQCLLSFLPQFNNPKAALMKHSRVNADESEVKVIGGIRWVPQALKIKAWNDNTDSANSQDRAFWLLSAIESLQWPDKTEFGVVDSLYDFLFPSETGETSTENSLDIFLDCYIHKLKFFLEPITFYFNVQEMEDGEKVKLADRLRIELKAEIARMADLTRKVGIWYLLQDNSECSHLDSRATLILKAILNISGPQYLSFNCTENGETIILSNDASSPETDQESQIDFFDILLYPYGIYNQTDILKTSEVGDSFIFDISEGRLELRYGKEQNVPCFESGKIELCNYLHEAMKSIPYFKVSKEVDWYVTAFHKMYKEFDEIRQEEDFARIKNEVNYIYKVLNGLDVDKCTIADIGVGYGRLAKKLLKENDIKIIGYDHSEELLKLCEDDLRIQNKSLYDIVHGDFLEISEKLSNYINKVDLALMMFTTFGCYGNDDQNIKVLKMAYDLLRPGGKLIIEQINPFKYLLTTGLDKQWQHYSGRECFSEWELYKSSCFLNDDENAFTKYFGHYYYIQKNGVHELKRCDFYELRLYTLDWFNKIAAQILKPQFLKPLGSFLGEDYTPKVSDLLIIEIAKPFTENEHKKMYEWISEIAEYVDVRLKRDVSILVQGNLNLDEILRDEVIRKYYNKDLRIVAEVNNQLNEIYEALCSYAKEK
jgi:SAM-dependent methyltransferase